MKRARMVIPILVAGTLVAAVSERAETPNPASVAQPPDTEIRECPQAHDSTGGAEILTSGSSGIPEFNDCQRFIVAGKFDSLYAIYATHPATVAVNRNQAVLVAVIRSFGGTYRPLTIRPGLSCLYLYNDRRAARVMDSSTSFFPCDSVIDVRRLSGPVLESRPTTASGFDQDQDYPQVARWDWDSQERIQYIGVKCGAAWCEIGRPGFHSSPSWKPAASLPYEIRRTIAIKGWYDEQRLAGPPPTAGELASVSRIRGTIFPHFELNNYVDDATWKGAWRTVAYVAMSATSPKYYNVMNLGATPGASPTTSLNPETLNKIQFCVGTAEDCDVPNPPICGASMTPWGWSRIVRAGFPIALYKCVTRWPNPPPAVPTPPSARWRWVSADETSWTKCSAGCCEVHS